jgi:membrane protein implicated in regulation of membrane protease activity
MDFFFLPISLTLIFVVWGYFDMDRRLAESNQANYELAQRVAVLETALNGDELLPFGQPDFNHPNNIYR